jgi:hypothetical protein
LDPQASDVCLPGRRIAHALLLEADFPLGTTLANPSWGKSRWDADLEINDI